MRKNIKIFTIMLVGVILLSGIGCANMFFSSNNPIESSVETEIVEANEHHQLAVIKEKRRDRKVSNQSSSTSGSLVSPSHFIQKASENPSGNSIPKFIQHCSYLM